MIWDIQTYSFTRKKTPTQHWIVKNDDSIQIEFSQSSGSITLTKWKGVSPPKEKNYFLSGLMNIPTSILDQWLIEIGAPALSYIQRNATKIPVPEVETEIKQPVGDIVRYIKECIIQLKQQFEGYDSGTILCCYNSSTKKYFLIFTPKIIKKYAEEKDSRDFAVAYSEKRLEDLKNKFLDNDSEVIRTLEFVLEEEKWDKLYTAKVWLIKMLKC